MRDTKWQTKSQTNTNSYCLIIKPQAARCYRLVVVAVAVVAAAATATTTTTTTTTSTYYYYYYYYNIYIDEK